MKPVAIMHVRMGSTRLPGKILKKLNGISVLEYLLDQLNYSKLLDDKIIATTTNSEADVLLKFCESKGIKWYRGNQDDVLDRYYQCAKKFSFDTIVRITSDCPLLDPQVVDQVIDFYLKNSYDYVNNFTKRTYPYGNYVEIFSFNVLDKVWHKATKLSDREHVTPYIYNNPTQFSIGWIENKENLSNFHWTVDRMEDLIFFQKIFKKISKRPILIQDIISVIKDDPSLLEINKNTNPNEEYLKSINEEQKFAKE